MGNGVFGFDAISRPGRREWAAIALVGALMLLFLPVVVRKTVEFGQGDVQVFFRAGWAIWTGYPLYEVADHHGWTYHYPPTFALFMGPFANPLPGYSQPWWALPYPAAVAIWYLINCLCLLLALHVWANALERHRPVDVRAGYLQRPWALRVAPLIALLPFIGDGLARGQPVAVLLFLFVLSFALYVENCVASAAFAFSPTCSRSSRFCGAIGNSWSGQPAGASFFCSACRRFALGRGRRSNFIGRCSPSILAASSAARCRP